MLPLRRKGAAAAAVPRRIGILKYKTLAHQCLFVFKSRAIQIKKTLRVDEKPRAMLLENFVAVASLCVQAHGIGKAGAAAALHSNAQAALLGRDAFLFQEFADFFRGSLT